MIEPMWMWAILGLVLLATEMATGTIYILWFGIAALCVAIAVWLFPSMPNVAQFIIFAGLSLGSLIIWKQHAKKFEENHRIGQAQGQEIGRVGTIQKACNANESGVVTFAQGLMGSKKGTAVSDETIEAGATVTVTAVEGNALRVTANN